MRPTFPVLSLMLLAGLSWSCSAPPASDLGEGVPADTLFINGNIVTMDPARPRAEAIAIKGDRISGIGSTAELQALLGPATEVIDLTGRTMIPGLVDGHLHFANLGSDGQTLDLGEARSEAEAAELVRRRAARTDPGVWITGNNWHTGNWADAAWPSRASLDEAAPHNPVVLRGMHGHAGWANTRALMDAGLTRATPDPPGGKVMKDPETGFPTGILIENAQALVRAPAGVEEPLTERVKKSVALALSYGVTGAHDMGTNLETVEAYRELIAADEFPFRINAYPRAVNAGEEFMRIIMSEPYVDPTLKLQMRGIKVSIDGALGSRGAAMMAPYADEPDNIGVIRVPYDQLYFIVERSLRQGWTLAIHAIGDRGNRMALDAVEQALARVPTDDHRIRIEHAQVLRPEDVPRFARLGIVTSWQWMHATLDMPWAETRIGPERLETAYAWRTLMNTGARLVGGSDEGARTFSPFMGIHAAVTRQDADGNPAGGWFPDQRLTREEALRSYTVDPAWVAFLEDDLGSLAPGKLADLVVLSKDIMTVPPDEILTIEAMLTMVGGKVAFERTNRP
jgi:predicted amidohydrolase YtcJ